MLSMKQQSYGQYSVGQEIREVNSERTDEDDDNSAGGGSSSGRGSAASPVYRHEEYDDKPKLVDEEVGLSANETPGHQVESIYAINRGNSNVERDSKVVVSSVSNH